MKWKSNLCANLASPRLCKGHGSNGRKGKLKHPGLHPFPSTPLDFHSVYFQLQGNGNIFIFVSLLKYSINSSKCNFKSQTKHFLSLPHIISVCQQKYTHKPIMFTYVHTASKPHCTLRRGESFCKAGGRRGMGSERWETFRAYHFPFYASDPKPTEFRKQVSSSLSRFWNRL